VYTEVYFDNTLALISVFYEAKRKRTPYKETKSVRMSVFELVSATKSFAGFSWIGVQFLSKIVGHFFLIVKTGSSTYL